MKLTPLDIHHKEFRHSLRGYSEEEVDQFLDDVADEFERLFKENIDLSERLDTAKAKLDEYEMQRHTINNTLVAAQRSADEIVAKAQSEAEDTRRDAETRAKEVIHSALQKKQAVANELVRIKHAEEEFRARYRSLLESQLRSVSEIELPEDIDVLMGDTGEGVVGDVDVRPAQPSAQPVAAQPVAPAQAPAAPAPAQERVAPSAPLSDVPAERGPNVVQAVVLGETGQTPRLDPVEFTFPSLDVLGQREDDDLDIEEID